MAGKRGLIMGLANDKSIAWGIAKTLADHGAEMAFSYQGEALKKRVDPLISSIGMTEMIECDVSDEAQVAAFFAAATAYLQGLDILVSNAGVAGPTANLEDISLADWRKCLAVNLDSAFLCARAAAPLLRAQGSGSMILMSSTAGLFGFPRRSPYASAKWAIRGLTRTLAQELGPAGVRVNCICPGSVSGERIDRVIAAEAQKTGRSEEAVRAEMTQISSLKSFISPQDIASMALFITSSAGARISGQDLTVDGHTETL
jgi:NAD(P)-dependent dehydrogenase (short-subunit alcohol dehydrogenase family)